MYNNDVGKESAQKFMKQTGDLRDGRRNGWADGMGLGMGGGMGLRVGFININDMYNNDVGKGVVYAYEAYEAK